MSNTQTQKLSSLILLYVSVPPPSHTDTKKVLRRILKLRVAVHLLFCTYPFLILCILSPECIITNLHTSPCPITSC
jgi:hypothetical protein